MATQPGGRSRLRQTVLPLLKNSLTVRLRRAAQVRPAGLFAWRELAGERGREEAYTLRRSGRRFVIRHRTRDGPIFDEVFFGESYDMPPEARAALGADGPHRIADLGANIGLFGLRALGEWPRSELVAFEPDPDNLRLLRRCIDLNGAGDRWSVVAACAAAAGGEVEFVAGEEAFSHAAAPSETGTTVTVPAVDVFNHLDGVALLKMDIEGGEWPILADARLGKSQVQAVALEYHARSCPGPDPHAAAVGALQDAGFVVLPAWVHPEDGEGLLWAWRSSR